MNKKTPTKTQILRALKCDQATLARMLNVTRGAVAQWPAGKPIPERRWLQLKHEVAPQVFQRAA